MTRKLPYRNHVLCSREASKRLQNGIQVDYAYADDILPKPKGFWYGFKDEWYKFLKEGLDCKPRYVYEVKLNAGVLTTIDVPDRDKVLQIKDAKDWQTFMSRYVKPSRNRYDWRALKRDFGGVEIPNYKRLERHFGYGSYLGMWDVSSGCVWNLRLINSVERLL